MANVDQADTMLQDHDYFKEDFAKSLHEHTPLPSPPKKAKRTEDKSKLVRLPMILIQSKP